MDKHRSKHRTVCSWICLDLAPYEILVQCSAAREFARVVHFLVNMSHGIDRGVEVDVLN